jgi:hypothetical protein
MATYTITADQLEAIKAIAVEEYRKPYGFNRFGDYLADDSFATFDVISGTQNQYRFEGECPGYHFKRYKLEKLLLNPIAERISKYLGVPFKFDEPVTYEVCSKMYSSYYSDTLEVK